MSPSDRSGTGESGFPDESVLGQAFLDQVAAGHSFIPLWKRWPADLETPLTTWLKVGASGSHGVLLESVEGGERIGRWSFVVTEPLWILTARGSQASRQWRDGRCEALEGNPFALLRTCLEGLSAPPVPGLPPVGQLFGFWGYELIQWIEPSVPVHAVNPLDPPDGCWMLADSLLVFDQVKRQITAIAYADLSSGADPAAAHAAAAARIAALEEQMHAPLPAGVAPLQWHESSGSDLTTTSNRSQADFEAAVVQAREHIAAGDVFQLVISQRLETSIRRDPFELYRSLRMVNPSPYMAFFNFGGWYLIGSSPEVMVKADPLPGGGIRASLRPIAGTRPRGSDEAEDLALEADLLADPKERAEHVMLVDLGRNDLGRVCQPGSVTVTDLMVIERYSHVMHIVSQVEGLLSEDRSVWDLLMAAFPAGTVSGAPKIRAMQLIHALEPDARGPYSGVYGAVDLCGALNTAITIRTMVVQPGEEGSWRVQVQAGAGLVADSRPTAEYQETLNKARGMLKALACLA
ncbi:anthranilate synthase component I and chorismate binding enzyme [Cyanobium sp. PCC 7001]|uniref:anthranilate synthase component I family protein n=1 Tax=Cyanobium sp. PCC 7001 TaxID=180281 RepID=UPI0001805580|nr:anthranilate synthase component I family protein [Cyanobium sp. PCC 7001]EDY37925.1 anthranilate synthase component I and chorismate binding enzyme [Cyanobium sp. PCC 7001]